MLDLELTDSSYQVPGRAEWLLARWREVRCPYCRAILYEECGTAPAIYGIRKKCRCRRMLERHGDREPFEVTARYESDPDLTT